MHRFGRSHIARMAAAAHRVVQVLGSDIEATGVLRNEHEVTASASGDRAAAATWADAALDYVALLREHIAKENQILFAMAERILSADDQARLSVEFAGVDTNKMGEGERRCPFDPRVAAGFRAYDSHQPRRKIDCGRDGSTAYQQSKRNSQACRKSLHPAFNLPLELVPLRFVSLYSAPCRR